MAYCINQGQWAVTVGHAQLTTWPAVCNHSAGPRTHGPWLSVSHATLGDVSNTCPLSLPTLTSTLILPLYLTILPQFSPPDSQYSVEWRILWCQVSASLWSFAPTANLQHCHLNPSKPSYPINCEITKCYNSLKWNVKFRLSGCNNTGEALKLSSVCMRWQLARDHRVLLLTQRGSYIAERRCLNAYETYWEINQPWIFQAILLWILQGADPSP